jgi:hypothetical protein
VTWRKYVCPDEGRDFYFERNYNLHRELKHDEYKPPVIVEETTAKPEVLK